MFIVFYDRIGKLQKEIYVQHQNKVLLFSDYIKKERRKQENKELFIAGEGTIITRLLEKIATDEKLLNEHKAIMFDEDIIGRIDEAIKIEPYFAKLLNSGEEILYYAIHESTILRLKETGLCDKIFEMN